jgi:hypothetical protein
MGPDKGFKFSNEKVLKTNDQNMKYEFEENGVFYGGDYLPKPPEELIIDVNTPTASSQGENSL